MRVHLRGRNLDLALDHGTPQRNFRSYRSVDPGALLPALNALDITPMVNRVPLQNATAQAILDAVDAALEYALDVRPGIQIPTPLVEYEVIVCIDK